ncbi:MAG: trehalose-phosphatase [Acidimicrobiia bacterium]
MTDLPAALRRLAAVDRLLVGMDFDGTLSEIVDRPDRAVPVPGAVAALVELGGLPRMTVSVVSGRSLADLRARLGHVDGAVMVGGHGAEWPNGGPPLSARDRERLEEVTASLEGLAVGVDGAWVERKPHSSALHLRRVDPVAAGELETAAAAGPARLPGVRSMIGKGIVEVSVSPATKASAVERLRRQTGAVAVLFVGDDVTDEDVFASLGEADVGVKVGDGTTAASHRVANPTEVVDILRRLAAIRRTQGW